MQYDIVLIIILILKTEEQTDTNLHLLIMVYFRRLRINDSTQTATIIVTDKPISQKQNTLAGFKVGTRVGNNITFGVLSLIDPETNKVMNASHPTIKALQKKLNQGRTVLQLPVCRLALATPDQQKNVCVGEKAPPCPPGWGDTPVKFAYTGTCSSAGTRINF